MRGGSPSAGSTQSAEALPRWALAIFGLGLILLSIVESYFNALAFILPCQPEQEAVPASYCGYEWRRVLGPLSVWGPLVIGVIAAITATALRRTKVLLFGLGGAAGLTLIWFVTNWILSRLAREAGEVAMNASW